MLGQEGSSSQRGFDATFPSCISVGNTAGVGVRWDTQLQGAVSQPQCLDNWQVEHSSLKQKLFIHMPHGRQTQGLPIIPNAPICQEHTEFKLSFGTLPSLGLMQFCWKMPETEPTDGFGSSRIVYGHSPLFSH